MIRVEIEYAGITFQVQGNYVPAEHAHRLGHPDTWTPGYSPTLEDVDIFMGNEELPDVQQDMLWETLEFKEVVMKAVRHVR